MIRLNDYWETRSTDHVPLQSSLTTVAAQERGQNWHQDIARASGLLPLTEASSSLKWLGEWRFDNISFHLVSADTNILLRHVLWDFLQGSPSLHSCDQWPLRWCEIWNYLKSYRQSRLFFFSFIQKRNIQYTCTEKVQWRVLYLQ